MTEAEIVYFINGLTIGISVTNILWTLATRGRR